MTYLTSSRRADRRVNRFQIVGLTAKATIRSTRLAPLAATASAALVITLLAARSQDADLALMGMRLATTALVIGVAFSLDDPAGHTTSAVPHQLRYRRLTRIGYTAGVWMLILISLLWLASSLLPSDQPSLPIPRLILEASGQAAAGLAIAVFIHRTHHEPGRFAGPALLGLVLVSWLLPGPLRPWIHPEHPQWETGQRIWTTVLLASLLLLTALSWDSRVRSFHRLPISGRGINAG